jgi:hypothetical protein
MAFGEHLGPSAQPEVDLLSISEPVPEEFIGNPEVRESGEAEKTSSSVSPVADGSLSDPDMEGAAHLLAFQRVLQDMEKWNRMFGRKDDLAKSPSDSLRQALEKLAQWIQEVVHRVIDRGSARTSHQNQNAENRP